MDIVITILQCVGGGLLIALGIASCVMDGNMDYNWGVIYIYYILFGIFLILHQLKVGPLPKLFGFLNYPLGKAFFSFFIGMFTFYWWNWLQKLTFSYFFALCAFYFVMIVLTGESAGGTSWAKESEYGTAGTSSIV
eukprot:TRINITY_DN9833_c0_g1_i12.p1 TRINITY_DN9833_c0_g1~~TRINITY_DN9833_c0_g1_i12.p1  ORF type:complete len:136 (+),score=34.92 TRINITY_DN9833_c0_g1_i12:115-522(+)